MLRQQFSTAKWPVTLALDIFDTSFCMVDTFFECYDNRLMVMNVLRISIVACDLHHTD